MLAQFAKNLGLASVVIDRYSDFDTQVLALECSKVQSLALEHVKAAVSEVVNQYNITYVLYGSGFEKHLNSLEFLTASFNVLGNSVDVFSAIQNKVYFFSRLNALQIPFPETSFQKPKKKVQWLLKPMQGEGGFGIKKHTIATESSDEYYWQKQVDGTPLSVLFIADGRLYTICGFQKQLSISIDENEFIFAGVMSSPSLDRQLQCDVEQWIDKLVADFGLRGMNSLDFIVKNNHCYALEVNARPSASMQLYESSILAGHINYLKMKRCSTDILNVVKAYQIVFSEIDLVIKPSIQWPVWVKDIPNTGVLINTGMPICSIIASGKTEQQVKNILLLRQQIIAKLL